MTTPAVARIAEFQGLYGSYHASELLLQKIWLRGEFDRDRARLATGEAVRVLHPGKWNRLGGPDFRGAKIALGAEVVEGDIEVHFRADAWRQHHHDADPAYDDVVLHVVLFPPPPGAPPALTRQGRRIPVLVLIDLLWHDLEEYATDDAIAALSGRDPASLAEELLTLEPAGRSARLREAAVRRWRQKVHFARLRIERVGWAPACHVTALEILGYSVNRLGMLRAGMRFPWSEWAAGAPALEALLEAGDGAWTTRGVRPANRPGLRLEQYRSWVARVPDWPERLREWRPPIHDGELGIEIDVGVYRRRVGMALLRRAMIESLCGGELAGARFDTMVGNLVLPFVAAIRGEEESYAPWFAWPPGDTPAFVDAAWRLLRGAGSAGVRCNGVAQALLALAIERQTGRGADGAAPLPA